MRVRLLRLALILGAAGNTGCVYYNGMYNANRLAGSARKAERDGRTFEANGLWGQVATKAESVMVRHPTSKYAAEAAVLRGVALARMGQCQDALGPLSDLPTARISAELHEDALLAMGRCQVLAGNTDAADAAFLQLLDSKSSDRRREAAYQHARLLRQTGRYAEALKVLSGFHDQRSEAERLLALAGAGQVPAAMGIADTLLTKSDSTRHWDSLVVSLGEENPVAASHLVDRVRHLPGRAKEAEARLLLEDGMRLEPVDTPRAARRFNEVLTVAKHGNAAGRAILELLRMDLRRVTRPDELTSFNAKLKALSQRSEAVSNEIRLLSAKVENVRRASGEMTTDTAQGDLRLFLAAEFTRDSLAAPHLAESLFRRIPEKFPASPYAPKAILAVQQLNPAFVDSGGALLTERYADSPYLAMVRGEGSDAYRQLEDSLAGFATTQARATAGEPTRPRRVVEEKDRELHRPPPGPRGSRVPEPQ
jgi:tetratricopeptide (TPR) repeat protein